jgi:hypothetical protein
MTARSLQKYAHFAEFLVADAAAFARIHAFHIQ